VEEKVMKLRKRDVVGWPKYTVHWASLEQIDKRLAETLERIHPERWQEKPNDDIQEMTSGYDYVQTTTGDKEGPTVTHDVQTTTGDNKGSIVTHGNERRSSNDKDFGGHSEIGESSTNAQGVGGTGKSKKTSQVASPTPPRTYTASFPSLHYP